MAISGWFVGLVALGVLPLIVTGEPVVLALWLLFVAVLATVDLLLAGSPRKVSLARDLPDRVRLGEAAESTLFVANTGGRRIRGAIRDSWQPSAGASPTRAPLDVPAHERRW